MYAHIYCMNSTVHTLGNVLVNSGMKDMDVIGEIKVMSMLFLVSLLFLYTCHSVSNSPHLLWFEYTVFTHSFVFRAEWPLNTSHPHILHLMLSHRNRNSSKYEEKELHQSEQWSMRIGNYSSLHLDAKYETA